MATNGVYRSRATIIKLPDQTPGLLFAASGQVPFTVERVWKSPVAPAVNMVVELETDPAGQPVGIWVVNAHHRPRQEANACAVSQLPGRQAADFVTDGISAWVSRMGRVTVAATGLLWLSWFSLPAMRLDVPLFAKSITFWELIAIDFQRLDPHGHRLLRLVGLLCLIAPIAAPFWASVQARLLYCLPLTFLLLFTVQIAPDLSFSVGDTREIRQSFSLQAGSYVLAAAAIVVAFRALKRAGMRYS